MSVATNFIQLKPDLFRSVDYTNEVVFTMDDPDCSFSAFDEDSYYPVDARSPCSEDDCEPSINLLEPFFLYLLNNFCERYTFVYKNSENRYSNEILFNTLCKHLYNKGFLSTSSTVAARTQNKAKNNNLWSSFIKEALHDESMISVDMKTPERFESNHNSISRYEADFVEEYKLGKGGFGSVFSVSHILDQTKYAVKKISVKSASDISDKVLREVRCLAKLDHHNVVRYYSAWVEYNHDQDEKLNIKHHTGNNCKLLSNSSEDSSDESINNDSFNNNNNHSYRENQHHNLQSVLKRRKKCVPIQHKEGIKAKKKKPAATLYIQMQLCTFSLRQWLDNPNRVVNPKVNVQIIKQILDGLVYTHQAGFIHRDLKPSNILIIGDPDSVDLSNCCIKLGDFGVATFIEQQSDIKRQQQDSAHQETPDLANMLSYDSCPAFIPSYAVDIDDDGDTTESTIDDINPVIRSDSFRTTGIGTVTYASPEQLRKACYDEKTDIYSLGIIYFELYTKFTTGMERAKTLSELRKNNTLPIEFTRKFPREATLIVQLIDHSPAKRPTAEQILKNPIFAEAPAYIKPLNGRKDLTISSAF